MPPSTLHFGSFIIVPEITITTLCRKSAPARALGLETAVLETLSLNGGLFRSCAL